MTARDKHATPADLEALQALPQNHDRRFELVLGEIVEVPRPSPLHAFVSGEIFAALLAYSKTHHAGFVFADSVSYELDDENVLAPDASFIAAARLPALPDRLRLAPDLAVEVVSPSNRPRQMLNRVEVYLRFGAREVWVVDPVERVVDVYRQSAPGRLLVETFTYEMTLSGGHVLPGLALPLSQIFPPTP